MTGATKNSVSGAVKPFTPKKVRAVTVPLHQLREGSVLHCKVEGPMELGKPEPAVEGKPPKEPVTLMRVINLETGELEQIICGAALRGIFKDNYPNDSYVGKGFTITVGEQKKSKNGGGSYNTYLVDEIEV